MIQERIGVVTLAENPVTLIGPEIKIGEKAPDFELLTKERTKVTLSDFKGKTRMITVVPSLDTGVCDMQTRRFNEEATKLMDDVVILAVSVDLPFAQGRWCESNGAQSITVLSDHLEMSFGKAYGTYMKEHRLECRAIFVIDANDTITYVEYVPEVTNHPNYDAVIKAAKETLDQPNATR